MSQLARNSGIESVGAVPWGTHFCHFYNTRQELLDILIPYFEAGLANNEYCLWVTSGVLSAEEAGQALLTAVPDLVARMNSGQMEIITHSRWHPRDDAFDGPGLLNGWIHKLSQALSRGFEGLRLTGNALWVGEGTRQALQVYETAVNSIIGRYPVIAACGYCLGYCAAPEVIEAIRCHQFALTRREGRWEIIRTLWAGCGTDRPPGDARWLTSMVPEVGRPQPGEDEIGRLKARLEAKTQELEDAQKELQSFAYTVSHDLRAPLRHLGGFVKLLSRKESDALDEQCYRLYYDSMVDDREKREAGLLDERNRNLLDAISRETEHMGELIEGLLSYSRVGRAEMRKINVGADLLVQEAVRELNPETAGRQITWEIATLPRIWADPILLRRVFVHLISNAIKFTRPRPMAIIRIRHSTGQNEDVFAIQDNGVGFDMHYKDKLFVLFQRLHRLEDFEGSGTGLAHVRRIIHRHGGRTWAEGAPDRGATFSFSLPRQERIKDER